MGQEQSTTVKEGERKCEDCKEIYDSKRYRKCPTCYDEEYMTNQKKFTLTAERLKGKVRDDSNR